MTLDSHPTSRRSPQFGRETGREFAQNAFGEGDRPEGWVTARGRKASVRYHTSKGGYFTHFEGKNTRLADGPGDAPTGKTYLAALARFQELIQVGHADTADQGNTVPVVVDLDGQHLERNGQARTLQILLQTCTSAVDQFGDKTFDAFKPAHVTAWLALMAKQRATKRHKAAKWEPTYQNIALRTLVAAFNRAKGQGIISSHRLENSKAATVRGRKRSRGGPDDFAWKNARRSGKDRVIFLTGSGGGCQPSGSRRGRRTPRCPCRNSSDSARPAGSPWSPSAPQVVQGERRDEVHHPGQAAPAAQLPLPVGRPLLVHVLPRGGAPATARGQVPQGMSFGLPTRSPASKS